MNQSKANWKKRLLTSLLAATLIASLVPLTALAEGEPDSVSTTSLPREQTTSFTPSGDEETSVAMEEPEPETSENEDSLPEEPGERAFSPSFDGLTDGIEGGDLTADSFATLQAAVDDIAGRPGSTGVITITGDIDYGASNTDAIEIPAGVTLRIEGEGHVLKAWRNRHFITYGNLTVYGLVLEGGEGGSGGSSYAGGGIQIRGADLFLDSVTINEAKQASRAAINANMINLKGTGGAIYAEYADITLRDTTISNSAVRIAGAIYLAGDKDNQTSLVLEGSTRIQNNKAVGSAGIRVQYGDVTLRDTATISGNESITMNPGNYESDYAGGGLRVEFGNILMTDDSLISLNHTYAYGGGILLMSGNLEMEKNATIHKNTAGSTNGGGGGLAVASLNRIDGFLCEVTLRDNATITENNSAPAGIFTGYYSTAGNGMSLDATEGAASNPENRGVNITMKGNSSVKNNNSQSSSGNYGGGIMAYARGTILMQGTAHVSGNSIARYGGGIALRNAGNRLVMEDDSYIANNTSRVASGQYGYGGGVYGQTAGQQIIMRGNAAVYGNTTNDPSAAGGGIYLGTGSLTMEDNSRIENNTSAGHSGGAYVLNLTMTGAASIKGNTAATYGGGIGFNATANTNGSLKLGNDDPGNAVEISGNHAGTFGGGIAALYNVSNPGLANPAGHAKMHIEGVLFEGNTSDIGRFDLIIPEYIDVHEHTVFDVNQNSAGDGFTDYLYNNYDINLPLYRVNLNWYKDDLAGANRLGTRTVYVQQGTKLADGIVNILEDNWLNLYRPAGYGAGEVANGANMDQLVTSDNIPVTVLYLQLDHLVTVEYYEDAVLPANLLDSESFSALDGTNFNSAIVGTLGGGWLDLHRPLAYSSGAVVFPASLPLTIEGAVLIQVLYEPLGAATVTVDIEYYEDSLTGPAANSTSITIPLGSDASAQIAAELGTGWLNLYKPTGYVDGVMAEPASLPTAIDDDLVVKVLYTKQQLSVVYHPTDGAGGTTVTLPYGDAHTVYTQSAAAVSYAGHNVAGWATAAGGPVVYTAGQTIPSVTANLDLYAVWQKNNHSVTFNTQGGTPQPAATSADYGSFISRPAQNPAKAGYDFDDWYTQPVGGTLWNFATDPMPDEPLTLYAQYDAQYFKVTFHYYGSYTSETTVACGSPIPKPPTPSRDGYTFLNWRNGSTGGAVWSFSSPMPAQEVHLYATWQENGGGGSSSGGGEETSTPSTSVPPPRSSSAQSSSSSVSSALPERASTTSQAPVSSSVPSVTSSQLPEEDRELDTMLIFGIIPFGGFGSSEGWSAFNLLLSILCLGFGLFTAVRIFTARKRRKPYENSEMEDAGAPIGSPVWKWAVAIFGLLPLPLLFLLENFSGPAILFSRFTPLFITLALVHAGLQIGSVLAARRRS